MFLCVYACSPLLTFMLPLNADRFCNPCDLSFLKAAAWLKWPKIQFDILLSKIKVKWNASRWVTCFMKSILTFSTWCISSQSNFWLHLRQLDVTPCSGDNEKRWRISYTWHQLMLPKESQIVWLMPFTYLLSNCFAVHYSQLCSLCGRGWLQSASSALQQKFSSAAPRQTED